jgi:acetyltransferase
MEIPHGIATEQGADRPAPVTPSTPDLTAWRFKCRSRDGAGFLVRPMQPDDIDRERSFITGLSEESRYLRLLYVMREPSPEFVAQMVTVDYQRTMAFVASTRDAGQEQFIAVARYASDARGAAAEFAIVVADAWQGRGVGSQVAAILFDYAASRGLETLYGDISATNQRMLELVRTLGLVTQPLPEDARIARATLDLRGRRVYRLGK